MSIAQQLAPHLPYLRRYARAMTVSQASGDAYVVSVLEALLEDSSIFDRKLPSRVALYKLFDAVWRSVELNNSSRPVGDISDPHRRIDALTPRSRCAFLLLAMERFDESETAQILGVEVSQVRTLIDDAGREIADQIATNVLIIEDEPLIAMDLEGIMEQLGHNVVGIARTHREAIELARGHDLGLILADIQLADGSSGLEAVNELLRSVRVPVIFITAFPERLLTGERAEPTYLITKPFQPSLVSALASQALFFDEKARSGAPS
ncbi:MAG: response regulator [Hyphomicrobiales bacterium]|nr:response regulator [Hyphomicrobiales bacterium]